ncbi:MAG: signal peptidase I [Thomasclavelia sp.]|nr:signal peptidase I [Thomasclavelia sp.]
MTDSVKKKIILFIKVLIIFNLLIIILDNFVFKKISVDGNSMYPTFENGESGLSNELALKTNKISRFNVVVAHDKVDNATVIKRVIGLPGETVVYINDKLYINGTYVKEDFLDTDHKKEHLKNHDLFTSNCGPFTLSKDEYFLCGDNRPVSRDSRVIGAFKKDDIISKDIIILSPISRMRIEG